MCRQRRQKDGKDRKVRKQNVLCLRFIVFLYVSMFDSDQICSANGQLGSWLLLPIAELISTEVRVACCI